MNWSEKEKWISYLSILHTSETFKRLSMEQKQIISEFIRKKIAPNIDHNQWLEIEKDLIKFKTEMINMFYEGMRVAIGGKMTSEAKEMFKPDEIAELDRSMKEGLETLDFNKMQEIFDKIPESERKEFAPVFEQIKKMTEEYKKEKKKK